MASGASTDRTGTGRTRRPRSARTTPTVSRRCTGPAGRLRRYAYPRSRSFPSASHRASRSRATAGTSVRASRALAPRTPGYTARRRPGGPATANTPGPLARSKASTSSSSSSRRSRTSVHLTRSSTGSPSSAPAPARSAKAPAPSRNADRYASPPSGRPSRKYPKSSRRQDVSYARRCSASRPPRNALTCSHAAILSRTPVTSVRRRVIEPSRTRQ